MNYRVSNIPCNPQGDGWKDTFAAEVAGDMLTVRRTDSHKPWGQ